MSDTKYYVAWFFNSANAASVALMQRGINPEAARSMLEYAAGDTKGAVTRDKGPGKVIIIVQPEGQPATWAVSLRDIKFYATIDEAQAAADEVSGTHPDRNVGVVKWTHGDPPAHTFPWRNEWTQHVA